MNKDCLKITVKYYWLSIKIFCLKPFVKIEKMYKDYKKILIMNYINNIILSKYDIMSEDYLNTLLKLNSKEAKKYIKEFNFE